MLLGLKCPHIILTAHEVIQYAIELWTVGKKAIKKATVPPVRAIQVYPQRRSESNRWADIPGIVRFVVPG